MEVEEHQPSVLLFAFQTRIQEFQGELWKSVALNKPGFKDIAGIYILFVCFRSGDHWRPPFFSRLGFSIWSISIFSTITPLGWRQVGWLASAAHIHTVTVELS